MRRILFLTLLLIALLSLIAVSPVSAGQSTGTDKQVVGYFTEWGIYGANYLVKNIVTSGSADRLTVINYAFANVAPDGNGNITCQLFDPWADYQKPWDPAQSVNGQEVTWPNPILGNFQQLKALKAQYPKLKVLISLGGWTGSSHFSDAALPENRVAFVHSCIDLLIKGNLPDPGWGGMGGPGSGAGVFDGIDIDWEYPGACGDTCNYRPEDPQNFTALLAEFRRQLNAVNPNLLLTIAASASEANSAKIQVSQVTRSLNWINLMTYDFHGAWETTTNFNSPLYTSSNDPSGKARSSVSHAVGIYMARGAPANKLVVGAPFYGYGWSGVPNIKHGLYQPAAGALGSATYNVIKAKGYPQYWDNLTKDAWVFDSATQEFWTYDDPQVMAQRSAFIDTKGLRGVMFWELSGDTTDGELIHALVGH
ncbi:MAG: glycoside hydrolase family 18 protein [Anaerolineae bacterium]